MIGNRTIDAQLLQRLPLPLAQLLRRSQNALTPLEQHNAAYFFWEASLKLLGGTTVVEYAELKERDADTAEKLKNLARPSVGHWWEFIRCLVPVLAEKGDKGFGGVRELVLGRARDDMPNAAGLFAALAETLGDKGGPRNTVRLTELFDRLVTYRNREIGHGAVGQRPTEFYRRMTEALTAGLIQILSKLDVVAGRRMVYIGDVRRLANGGWLIERYLLANETPSRLEPLQLTEKETAYLPRPESVCLEGRRDPRIATPFPTLRSLQPLIHFDLDANRFYFLNSCRGKNSVEYLCYTNGDLHHREVVADPSGLLSDSGSRPAAPPTNAVPKPAAKAPAAAVAASAGKAEKPAPRAPAAPVSPPASKPAPAPGMGRTVGGYELLSRLGQGGMGVVYRAWQPSLGRQVALKCMMRINDPKGEARFAREISALGRVEHPSVVKVYTSGVDGDQWYYAMELIEGAELSRVCDHLIGSSAADIDPARWHSALTAACAQARTREQSLRDTMSDAAQKIPTARPAPPAPVSKHAAPTAGKDHIRQMVSIVREIAEAAHALHEAGVVHRDIKPGNIMLTGDGSHAVLMDLGLAQLADETEGRPTRTRQFVGTLRYASPEQVLDASRVDRRTDIYSLGVTLWEMLTLKPAYGADDNTPTLDLMLKIQSEELDNPRRHNRHVPRDLASIVMKCVDKDRGQRYATAADLAEDLGRFLRGEPVSAQPPTFLYLAEKFGRRHRVPLIAAAVFVLLFVLGTGGMFLRISAERNDALKAKEIALQAEQDAKEKAEAARAAKELADAAKLQADFERQRANDLGNIVVNYAMRKFLKQHDPKSDIPDLVHHAATAEDLLKKNPRADEIKFDLADTYDTLCNLYLQKRQRSAAAAALKKCIDYQEQLCVERPMLMITTALNYLDLGGIYGSMGERDKEVESDERALALLTEMKKKNMNIPPVLAAMGQVQLILGVDYQVIKGEPRKGLDYLMQAVGTLEDLSKQTEKDSPNFVSYQNQLAKAYQEVGIGLVVLPNAGAAELRESLANLDKAAQIYAKKSQYRASVAEIKRWQAKALVKLKEPEKALAATDEGMKLLTAVYYDLPEKSAQAEPTLRSQALMHCTSSLAYQEQKDYAKAEQAINDALVICARLSDKSENLPVRVDTQLDLAKCYANQQKFADALRSIALAISMQESYIADAPQDYTRKRMAGHMCFEQGRYSFLAKEYKQALESFLRAKKHESEAVKESGGGEDYTQNFYVTNGWIFSTQLELGNLDGALAAIREQSTLSPRIDKHKDIASNLLTIYRRDKSKAPAIADLLDDAFAKRNLDVERMKADPFFNLLQAEAGEPIRQVVRKHQKT